MRLQILPDPHAIDAIIFDFGGVLFDIDYYAPVRAFQELGYADFESMYSKKSQTQLFDDMETGKAHRPEFLAHLRPLVPLEITDAQIIDAWNAIFVGLPKERGELVHKVKTKYRTFILSNTNSLHVKRFEEILDETVGMEWFKSGFEQVYYSNEIGIKKPHPETYLEICRWNDLQPDRTLFIDDSIQHVEGAVEAGLKGYWLDVGKEDILEVLGPWC